MKNNKNGIYWKGVLLLILISFFFYNWFRTSNKVGLILGVLLFVIFVIEGHELKYHPKEIGGEEE